MQPDLEAVGITKRYGAQQAVAELSFSVERGSFFSILGPYGYNGSSYFTLIENQMRHIVRCLRRAREEHATRVEVSEEANARYLDEVLGRRGGQVFFQGGCATAN